MPAMWQKTYRELQDYIAANPQIEISPSCVVIMGDIRPEFYRLFDTIRVELVKEYFPQELERAFELGQHWAAARQAAIDSLGVTDIELHANVKWFLADPINGLIRYLFDPLFDLLKGRSDETTFESKARELIATENQKLFREGYQRWAEVCLINLLDGDRVYSVPAMDHNANASEMEGDPSGGLRQEGVSEAEETNKIVFEYAYGCSFLTPRIIIHSRKLGQLVSLRADFYEARWKARLLSENQEWLDIKGIQKEFGLTDLWPNLAIYVADDIRDLFLVADYHVVARPDIILDFEDSEKWYSPPRLERIKRHYRIMKPRLGSFLVSRKVVPEEAFRELEPKPIAPETSDMTEHPENAPNAPENSEPPAPVYEEALNIRLIGAGYDPDALAPVIDALVSDAPAEE